MIRISDTKKEPYWLDIAGGVSFKLRPYNTVIHLKAKQYMHSVLFKAVADFHDAKDVGGKLESDIDLEDLESRQVFAENLMVEGYLKHALIEWKGVLNLDNDDIAEITDDNIRSVLENPRVYERFLLEYVTRSRILDHEKKDLQAGSSGTSEEDQKPASNAQE